MKKTTIISVSIAAFIFAATIFVLVGKKADAPAANTDNEKTYVNSQFEKKQARPGDTIQNGQYVEYSEAELANNEGENYLFFHAPWCPQCQAIEKSIDNGGSIPEKVTIYKVDYDSNQELRKKYGVTLQTTFVKVDNQGNFLDKYVAYDSPSIESVVENFINK